MKLGWLYSCEPLVVVEPIYRLLNFFYFFSLNYYMNNNKERKTEEGQNITNQLNGLPSLCGYFSLMRV